MSKSIVVRENERAFLFKNGEFKEILVPGQHVYSTLFSSVSYEVHMINNAKVHSNVIDSIASKYPEDIKDHIEVVQPADNQVAIVYLNSKIIDLLAHGSKGFYWKDAGIITYEYITIGDSIFVSAEKNRLFREIPILNSDIVHLITVPHEHTGILYIDNVFHSVLEQGVYYVWSIGRAIESKIIDLRLSELEVLGQEILSKDKVTLRANVVAYYQVTNPMKAVSDVADYKQYIYKQIQFALRKSIESKTLDEVLDSKSTLDEEVTALVITEVGRYGITIDKVSVKDVILPGEMRDILNQVIQAEKQAQANVIKRREETAATRSLLNTAKLMGDHPMLLRLKELESLETILQKVDNLSVYGGVENLLGNLLQPSKK